MDVPPKILPPENKKELFERVIEVLRHGVYEMPVRRYSGTGAPGLYLEDLLGITTGNKDIPDSVGWELKYHTQRTSLITLFHREPQPKSIMRYMVSKYGWKDKKGRLSFRHTIAGKSDRFRIVRDVGQVIVRPIKGNGSIPYWTDDDILSVAGRKIGRLLLVRGYRNKQEVSYDRVVCFENVQLSEFIDEILRGNVLIDFDARESKPGSRGLRNHGTKFRVSPQNVCRLYAKKERIG